MEKIRLEATDKSPGIFFDPQNKTFEMEGVSRPENVRDFFIPVMEKLRKNLEEFLGQKESVTDEKPLKCTFKLEYFNSSSAKFISDILVMIGNYHKKGMPVKLYWYFKEGDEDILEVGEDFSEMIDMPFQMVMIER
ncbi:MAG: DUF1987 domain-containing protein [Bacteroidales bacterium]|nr:DUF1987 domain-containing protein [Bacteroidales bacterium]